MNRSNAGPSAIPWEDLLPRRLVRPVTCATLAALGLYLSACAPTISVFAEPARVVWGDPAYQRQDLDIPAGHLPPPGMCRIWFPDRPPGQQPPPGDCDELQYRIPPGAALVYG